MSQNVSKNEYKTVKDLTQDVIEHTQKIYGFPSGVKITEAKLLIGPDGWGGHCYLFELKYEVDGVRDYMREEVHADLTYVVLDMLFLIKDLYQKTHFIH